MKTDVYIRYEPARNSSFVMRFVPKANGHKIVAQFHGDAAMERARRYINSSEKLRLVCSISGKPIRA